MTDATLILQGSGTYSVYGMAGCSDAMLDILYYSNIRRMV